MRVFGTASAIVFDDAAFVAEAVPFYRIYGRTWAGGVGVRRERETALCRPLEQELYTICKTKKKKRGFCFFFVTDFSKVQTSSSRG